MHRPFLLGLLPLACAALGVAFLTGCPSKKEKETGEISLERVSFDALQGWTGDRHNEALPALRHSCGRLLTLPDERPLSASGLGGTAGEWKDVCRRLAALDPADPRSVRLFFETSFQPWKVTVDERTEGLFTGYYEASLNGSFEKSSRYRVPLHAKPDGLQGTAPENFRDWPDRRSIEAGALEGKTPVLLWVDDAVDAHVLHIQGSGQVTLPNGQIQRVGFAATNGHPFKGLGRILIDEGKVEAGESHMPAIRHWLKSNPDQANALMAQNPRYVFFRLIDGDGPIGAQGVPLTPERSLAVDPAHMPMGAPLWLDSEDPLTRQPLRRLMVAQDTGSAIKGPIRGDFFWGGGEDAFQKAGRMKSKGSYYLLLPRK